LGRCLGFEIVTLSDIIDVDLSLCLDSVFTNEMQIEVGCELSERCHSVGTAPLEDLQRLQNETEHFCVLMGRANRRRKKPQQTICKNLSQRY
jgi:hypothetical protein